MQSGYPKVAVVTPVYNGAKFIAGAIESVQAQTYPNLVHIILNNASTDATGEIIQSFTTTRVPIVVHRNDALIPMTDNFNKVVSLVPDDVDYFALLCADDRFAPNAISAMVNIALRDPAVKVVSGATTLDGRAQQEGWPADRDVLDGREAVRLFLSGQAALTGLFVLFRNTKPRCAPFYDPTLTCNDADAALREMIDGKFGYAREVVGDVQTHGETQSNTLLSCHYEHYSDFLRYIDQYGARVFEPAEHHRVRREFLRRYVRRMTAWGLLYRKWDIVGRHLEAARRRGNTITMVDFLDAWFDRALGVLGLRPQWDFTPVRQIMLFELIPPPDVTARRTAG